MGSCLGNNLKPNQTPLMHRELKTNQRIMDTRNKLYANKHCLTKYEFEMLCVLEIEADAGEEANIHAFELAVNKALAQKGLKKE